MTLNNIFLSSLLIVATTALYAQKKSVYRSKYFKTYSAHHKTLAIIPVTGIFNLTDDTYSDKEDRKLKYKQAQEIQKLFESYIRDRRKKKSLQISIQDTHTTNLTLEKNGINYDEIKTYTIKTLSEVLKVDAIISITVNIDDSYEDSSSIIPFFNFSSSHARVTIKISDGKTRKLLWKYEKIFSSRKKKNARMIIINAMKQASREFPYQNHKTL